MGAAFLKKKRRRSFPSVFKARDKRRTRRERENVPSASGGRATEDESAGGIKEDPPLVTPGGGTPSQRHAEDSKTGSKVTLQTSSG